MRMNVFRSASGRLAIVGAGLVLMLAAAVPIALGHSKAAGSGKAAGAVTNYLTYVHGKAGRANPRLSKVYIGWVNQQGGQVVIGGLDRRSGVGSGLRQ